MTKKESIAFFDSIDGGFIVRDQDNENIDGIFYNIVANKEYSFSTQFFNDKISSIFSRYVFPLDLSNEEIIIQDKTISHLYLIKNKIFTFNFAKSSIEKTIALSQKTLNAKIIIKKNNENFELNGNNLYYEIEKDFKGKLIFETNEYDAFIHFLEGVEESDNSEYLFKSSYDSYKIKNKTSILVIPYTQNEIEIELSSFEPFEYSFSGGFSNDYEFYYKSITNKEIEAIKDKDNKHKCSIKFSHIYRNVTIGNEGFFIYTININLDETNIIYLNYNQISVIDDLLEEEVTENFCKDVIRNLQDLFEIYVYSDIAKNPPQIERHPNYHHDKINIKERLNNIKTTNRKYYEFYQEIQLIIASVKDLHLSILASKTEKKLELNKYSACLPFFFYIKEFNSENRIFIYKYDSCYNLYDKDIQNVIDKHLSIPVKRINKMDLFEYIQNWSKFRTLKNVHAQFSKRLWEIFSFNLMYHPLNYSDLVDNE